MKFISWNTSEKRIFPSSAICYSEIQFVQENAYSFSVYQVTEWRGRVSSIFQRTPMRFFCFGFLKKASLWTRGLNKFGMFWFTVIIILTDAHIVPSLASGSLFMLASGSFRHKPSSCWHLPGFPEWPDVPGHCTFSASSLEAAVSPRRPGPFQQGMVFWNQSLRAGVLDCLDCSLFRPPPWMSPGYRIMFYR